jgi:hypothetical protein
MDTSRRDPRLAPRHIAVGGAVLAGWVFVCGTITHGVPGLPEWRYGQWAVKQVPLQKSFVR